MKTMSGWKEFILQANMAWHSFQEEEWRRVQGIHKGLDKDGSSRSGIYLPDEPGMFKFVELHQVFGDIEFTTLPKREKGAVDDRTSGEMEEDS